MQNTYQKKVSDRIIKRLEREIDGQPVPAEYENGIVKAIRIVKEESFIGDMDRQAADLTTYNGMDEAEIMEKVEAVLGITKDCGDASIEQNHEKSERSSDGFCAGSHSYGVTTISTPDFLLLLDAVNGMAHIITCRPSKDFQRKYADTLRSMAKDLLSERLYGVMQEY